MNDRLLANHHKHLNTVLVIDEAQSVEDERTFEDLRLLLNFQLNDRFLISVVLLGQPELRERVEAIPQLSQRIAVRYHLAPLTEEETHHYIRFRLKTVGGDSDLFTKDAASEIHRCSGGVSRLINVLCDACLFMGAQEKLSQIDLPVVLRASKAIA